MIQHLTRNYNFFVTKDGGHFVVHNLMYNSKAAYKLGDTAEFNDEGVGYRVIINSTKEHDKYDINLERIKQ